MVVTEQTLSLSLSLSHMYVWRVSDCFHPPPLPPRVTTRRPATTGLHQSPASPASGGMWEKPSSESQPWVRPTSPSLSPWDLWVRTTASSPSLGAGRSREVLGVKLRPALTAPVWRMTALPWWNIITASRNNRRPVWSRGTSGRGPESGESMTALKTSDSTSRTSKANPARWKLWGAPLTTSTNWRSCWARISGNSRCLPPLPGISSSRMTTVSSLSDPPASPLTTLCVQTPPPATQTWPTVPSWASVRPSRRRAPGRWWSTPWSTSCPARSTTVWPCPRQSPSPPSLPSRPARRRNFPPWVSRPLPGGRTSEAESRPVFQTSHPHPPSSVQQSITTTHASNMKYKSNTYSELPTRYCIDLTAVH